MKDKETLAQLRKILLGKNIKKIVNISYGRLSDDDIYYNVIYTMSSDEYLKFNKLLSFLND